MRLTFSIPFHFWPIFQLAHEFSQATYEPVLAKFVGHLVLIEMFNLQLSSKIFGQVWSLPVVKVLTHIPLRQYLHLFWPKMSTWPKHWQSVHSHVINIKYLGHKSLMAHKTGSSYLSLCHEMAMCWRKRSTPKHTLGQFELHCQWQETSGGICTSRRRHPPHNDF